MLEAHHSSAVMCCLEYSANLSHATTQDKGATKASKRIEDQLTDITTSLEDWLFYLQDLIDLKIDGLHIAFVQYFTSNFVYQILLDPILRFIQDLRGDSQARSPTRGVKSAKDSEETLIFSISVSLYFINRILMTISDTLTKRALICALFHPLSRKCRKLLLARIENPEMVSDSEAGTAEDVPSSTSSSPGSRQADASFSASIQDRNVYRDGFVKILTTNFGSGLGNRLPLLATLLVQNVISCGFCRTKQSSFMGSDEDTTTPLKPEYLADIMQSLGIWPHFKEKILQPVTCVVDSLDSLSLGGSLRDGRNLVADCVCQGDSEVGRTDPDLLSVRKLLDLRSELPASPVLHIVGIDAENSPLVHTFCSLLMEPAKNSLVTLQSVASCLFNIFCLSLDRRDKNLKPIMCFEDVQDDLQFLVSAARSAVKLSTDNILKRLLTSTGDISLSLFQEELRRPLNMKWTTIFPKMAKDSVLLLPPVSSVTLKIGLEFGMPISQMEATRREIQTFLLTRTFFKQVHQFITDQGVERSEDDLCAGLVNI